MPSVSLAERLIFGGVSSSQRRDASDGCSKKLRRPPRDLEARDLKGPNGGLEQCRAEPPNPTN
jgi:hypothetical protein